jgi:hypothetical protein
MKLRQLILAGLTLLLAGGTANAAQKLTMNYTTGESDRHLLAGNAQPANSPWCNR